MTTHEVLVDARNRLDRYGWLQRYDQAAVAAGVGPNCPLGHLDVAQGSTKLCTPGYEALCAARGHRGIGAWNDEPGRTKEEVLALFDKAIAQTAPAPADPFEATAQLPAADRRSPGRKAAIPKVPVDV